ncbi:sialate O-acetylesterase [Paenibacillus flagellatus]|uniref:Sialate O-acetylesterase domain-containing protein n=1 Tax=Paenibacillus flagellatus TaxID=2211139 RepID=A0A2V5KG08_9BACL|nr:sialate O-acetylesterase [Paenibacillus flagellatus]PYI53080.1 hypothetical protein DLM86_18990 [Paenibacillus flagellatus]
MSAAFELAAMFSDHMVLQQKEPVPVWGSGPDGGKVTVELDGQAASTVVRDGRWQAWLPPLRPGGPFELRVRLDGRDAALRRDVQVGDVWLMSGQSNMVMPLLFTEGGVEEADRADEPGVRFFTVPRRPYPGARIPGWDFMATFTGDAEWRTCTPDAALRTTAIGYYFGTMLGRTRGVPVGIVDCSFGATPIEAWMSERALERNPELKRRLDDYRRMAGKLDPERYEREWNDYLRKLVRWKEERGDLERRVRRLGLEGYLRWVADHPLDWTNYPFGPKAPQRPAGLYRSMLRTVIPYGIRGVVWYQGESNCTPEDAHAYRFWLQTLMHSWREEWNIPELPFLVVQLPSFRPGGDPTGETWAVLRESQQAAADAVPGTGLVVTIDCGDERDIHPTAKRPVAERLAAAARAVVYGEEAKWSAPRFRSMETRGSLAIVSFDGAEGDLTADAEPIPGFELCGNDGVFRTARARLVGGRVEASCPDVAAPSGVRYAWGNAPAYGLRGVGGLPVAPFRYGPVRPG